MKHKSFQDEEEWRLVAHISYHKGERVDPTGDPGGRIRFRHRDNRVIPYEALSFSTEAATLIREIVVGYSPGISLDAVRLLLLENGLNPSVRRSEVPVRP